MWNPFKKKSDSFDDGPMDGGFPGEGQFPPGADPLGGSDPMGSPFPNAQDPLGRPDPLGTPSAPPGMGSSSMPPPSAYPPPEPITPSPAGFGSPRPILSEQKPMPSIAPVSQNANGDKIEVVIAKLDSLKSMMDVMNQRIANIENKIGNNRQW